MIKNGCFILAFSLLAILVGPGFALGAGNIQGLIGAAKFESDSLTFIVPAEGGGAGTEEKDLHTMPYLGVTGQYSLAGKDSQVGAEAGAFFGWRSRHTNVIVGSGGTAVSIDSNLWLMDLSAGIYVSHMTRSGWRFYLGAGPAMVFGEYKEDGDETEEDDSGTDTSDSDSEFGVGAYARAGIEYQYLPGAMVGFSVRGLVTNLEFESTVGDEKVSGVQGFVTFTAAWPSSRYRRDRW